MLRRRLTRRQTIQAGAVALAAGLIRPVPALAAPASLFELPLDDTLGHAAASGWRTTPVLSAPRRFDLLGLHWSSAEALRAQVRTRTRAGGWSSWTELHTAGSHAPDGERVRGTEPAFTGAADLFQLRLRGSARGLRARFVRAQPTARAAGRLSTRAHTAQAATPRIITRAEWGAGAAPPRSAPAYGQVQLAFIHHTVTTNHYGPEQSAGIVLGILRYHRDSNGWGDIGYNFLVDKYGQIFEGRAGGMDRSVVGAQAQGFNSVSTGIACLGDFSTIAQSPAALEALARLLAWKLPLHDVPLKGQVTVTSLGGSSNRFPSGRPVTFERVSGHRDGNNTSCPGGMLYAQLPALRDRAAGLASAVSAGPVLSLALNAKQVRPGEVVTVRGTVNPVPQSGRVTVELVHRQAGEWITLRHRNVRADSGRYEVRLRLPLAGRYRVLASTPEASLRRSVRAVV